MVKVLSFVKYRLQILLNKNGARFIVKFHPEEFFFSGSIKELLPSQKYVLKSFYWIMKGSETYKRISMRSSCRLSWKNS